jgi:hypothetical protein
MDLDYGATSLPQWILYPSAAVLVLAFLLFAFFRAPTARAKLVLFIPWFRYLLTFFHSVTFQAAFAGLSWMALTSSAVFLAGVMIVRRRDLLRKRLLPIYTMIFVIFLSGVANHSIGGTIDAAVKFGYLLVISVLVFESLNEVGEQKMSRLMLWPFVMPFVFLGLSVLLGVVKASEKDGSASYIGGYSHESGFSTVLATCFVIACFATSLPRWSRRGILLACIAGIILANYRTTILAMTPMVLVLANQEMLAPFRPKQRRVILIGTAGVSIFVFFVAAWIYRERFADLVSAFEPWDRLLKPPYEYTLDDRALLSGRAYIWSDYIYSWAQSDTLNQFIGLGANSWIGVFQVYAHNTLVSGLYEYGPVGVVALLYLWLSMLSAALKVRRGPRALLVAAHLSFMILNMATMPHWMIEGDILYGFIVGYTLYFLYRPQSVTVGSQKPAVNQANARKIDLAAEPVGQTAR